MPDPITDKPAAKTQLPKGFEADGGLVRDPNTGTYYVRDVERGARGGQRVVWREATRDEVFNSLTFDGGGSAGGGGLTFEEQLQLKNTPSSSYSVSQSFSDPNVRAEDARQFDAQQKASRKQFMQTLALQMETLGLTMQEAERDARADAENMKFLREKFAFEQEQGKRSLAIETQRMAEQVQSRLDANAIQRERMALDRTQLQAQIQQAQAEMDFTASRENVRNRVEAEGINESRRQANLQQRQGVARDIADFSRAPGDAGALASFLLAGGASPLSTAQGQGESAITDQSLLPLDLLLANRDELNKGPTLLDPGLVTAPRIGGEFMGVGQPQLAGQESVERPEDAQATAARGQANQQQALQNAINFIFAGGATGPTPGGETDRRLQEFQTAGYLKQDEQGNFIKAADGFAGIVDKPTLFLAGEEGPESVNVTPKKQSRGFLEDAFELALNRSPWKGQQNPTPVGVSAPGTNAWVQQLAAALAALGQGTHPGLFLEEAMSLRPQGVSGAPIRRSR